MTAVYVIIAVVVAAGAVGAFIHHARYRAARLAPWKQLRNNMTPDEVRALLGQPRQTHPLDEGENWDYGRKPGEASVIFTNGRVTGYVKPF